MDYNKLWSLINKQLPSKSAAARIVKMSPQGFISMMDNNTITVATLEKFADYFRLPISYFFEGGSDGLILKEPIVTEYSCLSCIEKQKQIELLDRDNKAKDYTILIQDKLIREYESKITNNRQGWFLVL